MVRRSFNHGEEKRVSVFSRLGYDSAIADAKKSKLLMIDQLLVNIVNSAR